MHKHLVLSYKAEGDRIHSFKDSVFRTVIQNNAGSLQDTIKIQLGSAVLLALRWPLGLVAWFVVLNNSFKDHLIGSRLFRFHPEHPRTTYMGAEADDWLTLRFHTTRPHRK